GRDRGSRRATATLGPHAHSRGACRPVPALLALLLLAAPAAAQEIPRTLFPAPQPAPEVIAPTTPAAPIKVEDLTPPDASSEGLADAEAALAGPLWAKGAPPEIADLLAQLPSVIAEPTLTGLQRSLLAAPMPTDTGA